MACNRVDIFDILDVSLREDTYSRLIVEVLSRSTPIAIGLFKELTGAIPSGRPSVEFRRKSKSSNDHPDIVLKAPTKGGVAWLVIESKILSAEGVKQTDRYRQACDRARKDGGCTDFKLVFMTLNGKVAQDSGWHTLTHYELAQIMQRHDVDGLLKSDPALSAAWAAYVARLEHYQALGAPADGDSVFDWLLNEPDQFFVTRLARARRLAPSVIGAPYTTDSSLLSGMGHEQLVIKSWMPGWITGGWEKSKKLEDCLCVHFELSIPLPFEGDKVTLHLHVESEPYLTGRQLEAMGAEADGFHKVVASLRANLHSRMNPKSVWKPSNRPLQVAKCNCPFTSWITVGELRKLIAPRLAEMQEVVTSAMIATGEQYNTAWLPGFA